MELVLKLHSVVDVITNSSTVIYTSATQQTVSTLKEALAALLKVAGVSEPLDSLFDIRLGYSEWSLDKRRRAYIERNDKLNSYKQISVAYEAYINNPPSWWNDENELWMGNEPEWLFITSKSDNPQVAIAAKLLEAVFETIKAEEYETN